VPIKGRVGEDGLIRRTFVVNASVGSEDDHVLGQRWQGDEQLVRRLQRNRRRLRNQRVPRRRGPTDGSHSGARSTSSGRPNHAPTAWRHGRGSRSPAAGRTSRFRPNETADVHQQRLAGDANSVAWRRNVSKRPPMTTASMLLMSYSANRGDVVRGSGVPVGWFRLRDVPLVEIYIVF
jgi:hypothetical protein